MLLCLSKRIIETDRVMRRQDGIERNAFMSTEVLGKTLGIVGLGNVGRRLAELCRGLLRMRVVAYDPYLSADEIAARGAEKVELPDLLRHADYVSINCPLTDETSRTRISSPPRAASFTTRTPCSMRCGPAG
jgi:D-3-phosphoglycerate dehydrogenase